MRILAALLFGLIASFVQAETLRVAVTTSFQNSGLSDVLLPAFRADRGIEVQLVVVGTGQALRLGQAGDVDAVLVHSRKAEDAFVAAGYGTHRREVMFNDFVLIGPAGDPAGARGSGNVSTVLRTIAARKPAFVSRGDDSGTHKREVALWQDIDAAPETFGGWYRSVGAGMGAALNIAAAMDAYILADRGSWLNFGNKGDLAVLFEGDPALANQYTFMPVNPARHPHVKATATAVFEEWLTSDRAENLINGYKINGERLFTFNAQR